MNSLTSTSLSQLRQGNNQTCANIRKFIYSEGKPEAKFGEKISFANPIQQSSKYLWNNWHSPEPWGVWSNGKKASFYLPKPEGSPSILEIELRALITENHPIQLVRVKINGEVNVIQISSSQDKIYQIPLSNFTNEFLWIEIETPDATSPDDAGLRNGDKRKLGVGLISTTFN
jgi:hypothetical protein